MWKMGWFEVVRHHTRSLKKVQFDKVNTSSYYPSIVTMFLSCTVSEI